ncbi:MULTISPECIES: fructosamine kinase family protein [Marinobacter]|jgi:fructosamine-3-kinase|uniref:fructosamine kinase family protein n=1 Tax=Marinobacter TaxID=2742 RepID=UPI00125908A3|nr:MULTISPECIES: fructosamine kinase family protein [Marinobacter]MCZ4284418.1 fructosamine kinase family protein [Marinobacter salarius]MDM8180705.1 fructosamine kinase family protein [Marinobacter salarius]VVT17033.1 Fructosamine kinase [Marinobacter salarius]VXB45500.1 Fructosamine-3-kinase [Marinobacter salarius]
MIHEACDKAKDVCEAISDHGYTGGMTDFVKQNPSSFPDALLCEARGLEVLAGTLRAAGVSGLRVPEVKAVSAHELVIPKIHSGPASEEAMAALGEGLAQMHAVRQPEYGFDADNMIGMSPQKNRLTDDWGAFFLRDRLGVQVGMVGNDHVRKEFETVLERQGEELARFLNEHCEHPSLLHGDLWSGNVLFDSAGPWLIDPAVYYGDREADIAMTELFGGFSSAFYRAYDRGYPRTDVYNTKRAIYNLYHTLNHYNLFGASYLSACRHNLDVVASL